MTKAASGSLSFCSSDVSFTVSVLSFRARLVLLMGLVRLIAGVDAEVERGLRVIRTVFAESALPFRIRLFCLGLATLGASLIINFNRRGPRILANVLHPKGFLQRLNHVLFGQPLVIGIAQ